MNVKKWSESGRKINMKKLPESGRKINVKSDLNLVERLI